MIGDNPTPMSYDSVQYAIYVDGSKSVGLGHLSRMRTLVRNLGIKARIYTKSEELCRQVFAGEDFEIYTVPIENRISDVIGVSDFRPRLVVLDPPYEPDSPEKCSGPAWQSEADTFLSRGIKVVRFTDEEMPTAHRCNLLINDHPDSADFYSTYTSTCEVEIILAGAGYFLVEESLPFVSDGDQFVFVSFGGSDQNNLLDRFAPSLQALARDHPVEIAAGASQLKNHKYYDGVTLHPFLEPHEFAKKLATAKVAVTASGNTLYERVAYQTAGVSVAQFPRQDRIGRAFHRLGLTCHLGNGNEVYQEDFVRVLKNLLIDKDMRESQRDLSKLLNIKDGSREIVTQVRNLIFQ